MTTAVTANSAPTLAEIKTWPATISVTRCALALGCGKSSLYDQIKRGELPVRTIHVGRRTAVVTASLVRLLETGEPDPQPPAPSALVAA
ncbi:putative DNA-binding transcriptional regulator AlpA [Streptomyces sp. V3I8]|uniref:DNA-binding protein n=1 Tax=Streptomyces sp. V3I8 TaxID=3042279 RepID=UPI002784A872|nr:DNA-binding protein [Streptomyces sp. V3I8]MDQ1039436.1 putative DNA-binding transcriptional regulator AlpA [Streptomyces sp. V3I8]